jgi:hypothetical protein
MNLIINSTGYKVYPLVVLTAFFYCAIAGNSQTEFLQSYGADNVDDYNQTSINEISDKSTFSPARERSPEPNYFKLVKLRS